MSKKKDALSQPAESKTKKQPQQNPDHNHRERFEQLLNDAVLGVKKKD